MAWRQIWSSTFQSLSIPLRPRFFSSSTPYIVKVGILEFLNGVGKGVETHAAKLESEIGDFQKLLVTRTLKLKKLDIPCKHADNWPEYYDTRHAKFNGKQSRLYQTWTIAGYLTSKMLLNNPDKASMLY